VTRRLLVLSVLAVAAVAAGAVGFSQASFTTSSQSQVGATAAHVRSWLRLYSQTSDPGGLTGYATRRVQSGIGPLCAAGSDESLTLDMGGTPASTTTYTFNRAFTVKTPTAFPDAALTQVTITATYVADAATGKQPIYDVRFSATTTTGGSNPSAIARNVQRQANVRMRASGTGWVVGQVYRPHVLLTVTYTGFTTAYYVYDIPLAVTITTW
jgi:type II secretory pathway pseudopilin PulG